jgi:hypothetical protein
VKENCYFILKEEEERERIGKIKACETNSIAYLISIIFFHLQSITFQLANWPLRKRMIII